MKKSILTTILAAFICFLLIQPADALKLPKIKLGGAEKTLQKVLTGAGIILLINQFGKELNTFINGILANKGIPNRSATKVVPILTFGQGVEAGACQVTGPTEDVNRVKAVLSISSMLDKGHKFNIQALVPTSSLNPTELKRVYGVGISAIIDYKL